MCEDPYCSGPMSDPVSVYSAEDLPQVFDDVYIETVIITKYICKNKMSNTIVFILRIYFMI